VFNQPALHESPSSAYVGVNVMSELEKSMRILYLESESVFRPKDDAVVAITCSTETKFEPGVGTFIDLNTTTPMACTVEEASKLVWDEVNSKRKYPDKTYEIVRSSRVFCPRVSSPSLNSTDVDANRNREPTRTQPRRTSSGRCGMEIVRSGSVVCSTCASTTNPTGW